MRKCQGMTVDSAGTAPRGPGTRVLQQLTKFIFSKVGVREINSSDVIQREETEKNNTWLPTATRRLLQRHFQERVEAATTISYLQGRDLWARSSQPCADQLSEPRCGSFVLSFPHGHLSWLECSRLLAHCILQNVLVRAPSMPSTSRVLQLDIGILLPDKRLHPCRWGAASLLGHALGVGCEPGPAWWCFSSPSLHSPSLQAFPGAWP